MKNPKVFTEEELREQFLQAWRSFFKKSHSERAALRMERVAERQLEALGPDHPQTVTSLERLSFILRALGKKGRKAKRQQRYAASLAYIQRALASGDKAYESKPGNLALLHYHATWPFAVNGQTGAAVEQQLEAIRVLENCEDSSLLADWLTRFYAHLGYWQREDGQLEAAIDSLSFAIELSQVAPDQHSPYVLEDCYQWIGEAYKRLGKRIAAENKKAREAQKEKSQS